MTVLRVDALDGTIIHADLWPEPAGSSDLLLDILAPVKTPVALAGLANILVEPGSHPRGCYMTSEGRDLCAHPAQKMAFLRDRKEGRFEFLLVEEKELALLRLLLSQRWVDQDLPGPGEVMILPAEEFLLDLGSERIDIRFCMPLPVTPPGDEAAIRVRLGTTSRTITCAGRRWDLLTLAKRPVWRQPPMAASLEEWRNAPDSQYVLTGEEEIYRLPIAVSDADIAWFYEKPFMGTDHPTGRVRCRPRLMREHDKYVIMARNAEGVIFDESGVCSEAGYLLTLSHDPGGLQAPIGMRCDYQRRVIDRQVLDLAPSHRGTYAVFTPATLSNYTHWLIDGLLVLHVMLPYLPAGTRLLLPATLHELAGAGRGICNHHDTLAAFGFADLAAVEVHAPYCRVEDVVWLDDCYIKNVPAELVRSFRTRALSRRPPAGRAELRIHIGRRAGRRILDHDALDGFLGEHGFVTYYAEDLSIGEQIDLFSRAAWVVGAHGAGFGNLIFCPPGTKIIDIMPDVHFQPYFSYMSNKLGLAYSVLPCPTTDGGVNGDILLDVRRLRALFRVMRNRL